MSFKSRYLAMLSALVLNKIPHTVDMDILRSDNLDYGDPEVLKIEILKLRHKPQCFICSNDFIARVIINTVKQLGWKVPEDTLVVGYDDSIESTIANPTITTIGMNKQAMGIEAIKTLLNRIENPQTPSKMIKIESQIIYRESTARK